MFNFFTVDLSAFYLNIQKDNLYCNRPADPRTPGRPDDRFHPARNLLLMAPDPVLHLRGSLGPRPAYPGKEAFIHLARFPRGVGLAGLEAGRVRPGHGAAARPSARRSSRNSRRPANRSSSAMPSRPGSRSGPGRQARLPRSPPGRPGRALHRLPGRDRANGGAELAIEVAKAEGAKCERCWNYSTHVGTSAAHPTFCARCEKAVETGRS